MEDENGLELSLGLSCGGSAGKSKVKDGSSDLKMEEGGNSKPMTSLKHFLCPSIEKPDSNVPQRSEEGIKLQENFWTDLGKRSGQDPDAPTDTHGNSSQFSRYHDLWDANNKSGETVEEVSDQHKVGAKLWPEASHKRKMPLLPFEEIKHQKKLERVADTADVHAAIQLPHSSSEASPYEGKVAELVIGCGKQHASEDVGTSSSSHKEDESQGNNITFRQKETPDQPVPEGFPHEGSAIRPGIAPGLKFGGSGSFPDLPWVSTTGPGPNGRTISGVTYRYGKNQIRIVCACHGTHMPPEEFIQHASADAPNPENNTSLASLPNGNPAASAQS